MATVDELHGLSPRQLDALRSQLHPVPDAVNAYDREPERWVRMESKPTMEALVRRGLVGFWQSDYPMGGYRGELTDAGMAARAAARGTTGAPK